VLKVREWGISKRKMPAWNEKGEALRTPVSSFALANNCHLSLSPVPSRPFPLAPPLSAPIIITKVGLTAKIFK